MSNGLSKNSTLKEVFDFLEPDDPEHDVAVHPITLTSNESPTARLMIIIQGNPDTSHTILANVMAGVNEMHQLAAQKRAEAEAAPKLIGRDGELLDGDKSIISEV